MQKWLVFTIINALIMGFFECSRKKAVEKNTIYEVLATVYLIGFIIISLFVRDAFNIELKFILIILLKAIVLIFAWLGELYSLKHLSMGIYSIINTSRIVFTILLSAIFLNEMITVNIFLGMVIVITGMILANRVNKTNEKKVASLKVFIVLIFSCLCNAISAALDKYLMSYITSSQIMYWVFLFMAIVCWMVLLIKQRTINIKGLKKNYWVLFTVITLVVGDIFLMMANADINSKAAIISVIKQLVVVETIILGRVIFKEKDTLKKFLYSLLIIFGIILTII